MVEMEALIVFAILFLFLLAYSLCYAAGNADERMEEWREKDD